MANDDLTKVANPSISTTVKEENVKIVYVHHNDPPATEDVWTLMGKAFYEADPELWDKWIEKRKKSKKRKSSRK